MQSMKLIVIVAAAGALGLAGAGCQNKSERAVADEVDSFFLADDASRSVWRALEAQAAAGAREDAMLYAEHFEGDSLSALGRDKLDLLSRTDARPLVVYVAAAADDDAQPAAREQSVRRWLSGAGIADDLVQVRSGPNLATRTPAAPAIARMGKTESPGGAANGTAGGGMGATGAGFSGGASN